MKKIAIALCAFSLVSFNSFAADKKVEETKTTVKSNYTSETATAKALDFFIDMTAEMTKVKDEATAKTAIKNILAIKTKMEVFSKSIDGVKPLSPEAAETFCTKNESKVTELVNNTVGVMKSAMDPKAQVYFSEVSQVMDKLDNEKSLAAITALLDAIGAPIEKKMKPVMMEIMQEMMMQQMQNMQPQPEPKNK